MPGRGLAAIAMLSCVAIASAGTPDDEEVYLQRFRQLQAMAPTGISMDLYQPREAVPGTPDYRPLPEAAPTERTIATTTLAAARAYAEANNSRAFIVWRDGRVEASAYFKGTDPATPAASASLAKPVTAAAVGRALALGKLRSLDQPVADFIKEWRRDPKRSKILVRHLLDMRSGFLHQALAPTAEDVLNRAYLHPRHEEVIIREYPIIDEPGTRYEYNNATSELVAVLIERATGRRYAEFLSTELFRRIGARGGEVWINRPNGTAHSGCCLMVPPEDFVRLAILFLDDGVWQGERLLPAGYVAEMRRGTPQNPHYGLGVYVQGPYKERRGFANPERTTPELEVLHSEPYLADDLFLFDGNQNQVVYIIPSQRLVIPRIGDRPPRKPEWDNSVLPNLVLRGLKPLAGAASTAQANGD